MNVLCHLKSCIKQYEILQCTCKGLLRAKLECMFSFSVYLIPFLVNDFIFQFSIELFPSLTADGVVLVIIAPDIVDAA